MNFSDFVYAKVTTPTPVDKQEAWRRFAVHCRHEPTFIAILLVNYVPAGIGVKVTPEGSSGPDELKHLKIEMTYETGEVSQPRIEFTEVVHRCGIKTYQYRVTHTPHTARYKRQTFLVDYYKMDTPDVMDKFDAQVADSVDAIKRFMDNNNDN